MFRQWRANVRYRIFCKQRQAVQQSLFLARPSFCQPLFEGQFEASMIILPKYI